MASLIRFYRVAAVVPLLAVMIPTLVEAGFLRVAGADPGTEVSVQPYDAKDKRVGPKLTGKANAKGEVDFGLGTIKMEEMINTVWIIKSVGGKSEAGEIKITPGTLNLASLEPFQTPSFAASTSVVAVVDVVSLLSQPNPFTLGESLTVTNGTISQTTAVTFKEDSNLSLGDILTPSQVASLPSFTGSVTVDSFDQFTRPVPEPASLTLLSLGTLGLLGYAWRRRKRAVA
jgi:hypothetical protein